MYYCSKWEGLAQFQNNLFYLCLSTDHWQKEIHNHLSHKVVLHCVHIFMFQMHVCVAINHFYSPQWNLASPFNKHIHKWIHFKVSNSLHWFGSTPFWFPDPLFGGRAVVCEWTNKTIIQWKLYSHFKTCVHLTSLNSFSFF